MSSSPMPPPAMPTASDKKRANIYAAIDKRKAKAIAKKQGWNIINSLTQDPSGLAKSLRRS